LINPLQRDYNLKIKILREDRKTPYEITENLSVENKNREKDAVEQIMNFSLAKNILEKADIVSNNSPEIGNEKQKDEITGKVVYVSSNEKIKNYSYLFLLFIFFLTVLFIAKRKIFFKT
jgi:hypothetical protein